MRFVLTLGLAAFVGGASADVAWPTDFDTKLAEAVAAWQPTGKSVGASATLDGASIMAGGRGFSAGYGSEIEPFDVNWHTFGWDFFTGVFNSFPPTGFQIFFR